MKLYFYFLDTKNSRINVEECEAEEKAKIYKLIGKTPYGYLNRTVNKSQIGRISGAVQNYIVLTKKNPGRAAEALTFVCKDDIRRAESAIRGEQEKIKRAEKAIDNIEKWRSENAGE